MNASGKPTQNEESQAEQTESNLQDECHANFSLQKFQDLSNLC